MSRYSDFNNKQKQVIDKSSKIVMEELLKHIDPSFSAEQIELVVMGIEDGLDVSTYADSSLSEDTMNFLRLVKSRENGLPYCFQRLMSAEHLHEEEYDEIDYKLCLDSGYLDQTLQDRGLYDQEFEEHLKMVYKEFIKSWGRS